MSDTNSRYPNLRLSGTPDRLGRVQKQRAFIASGGKPLRMADLLPRSYPRATTFKKWHRTNVHRAVVKVAVRISKTGRGLEWAATEIALDKDRNQFSRVIVIVVGSRVIRGR